MEISISSFSNLRIFKFSNYRIMIYVSDKAKTKVERLMQEAAVPNKDFFLRVSVVGGGCSGLSYKLDFACKAKGTQLSLNTRLQYFETDGLNGKGFYFSNPNASRSCGCGESFAV